MKRWPGAGKDLTTTLAKYTLPGTGLLTIDSKITDYMTQRK